MTEMPEMPKMPEPEMPEAPETIFEAIRRLYEDNKHSLRRLYEDNKHSLKRLYEDNKHSLKRLYEDNKRPLVRIAIHLGLYYLALIMAYGVYKEFSKGYEHVISHFIGTYLDTPELSRAARDSIKHAFPWAILIFTVFYYVAYSRKKRADIYLSPVEYLVLIALSSFSINLLFIFVDIRSLVVLNMAVPFFFILLCLFQLIALYHVREWFAASRGFVAKYFTNQVDKGLVYLRPYAEPLMVVQDKAENSRWLVSLAGNPLVVFISYFTVAVTAYLPTINHIFRSDHWLFIALARSPNATLQEICSFDMFGHMRLDPLRWLMFYEQNVLLGNNMAAYHLLSIATHVINGLLIFLIAKTVLRSNIFSFLLGLLFTVLASHFDTVVWTLLFDAQISTLFYLTAVLCLARYLWCNASIAYIYIAIIFSAVPVLILESFLAGPVSIFLSFVLLHYFSGSGTSIDTRKQTKTIAFILVIFYAAFFYLTMFSQAHVTTEEMGFSDILTLKHLHRGLFAAFAALVDMSFLNNSGIFPPKIEIHNLVNLHAVGSWYKIGGIVKFLVFAPLVLLLFYYSATNKVRYFTLPILFMAATSLAAIGVGRIFTGGFNYIITRSHYAYFPNAMLLILLGLLIWPPDNKMKKLVIYLGLTILIILNFINTRSLNTAVDAAVKPMNTHHQRITSFLGENPNATLFLNFTPHNTEDRFSMATDIAFDILFADRVTKSMRKATHIYDPVLTELPVELKKLPKDVKFPKYLEEKIFYDYPTHLLYFEGAMSKKEREELLGLSQGELYQKAIDALFNRKGTPFVKNQNYSPDLEINTLGDFTVEWLCAASPETFGKEVALLGSEKTYPKISITPAGFIEIQMMHPETRTLDSYGVPYPHSPLFKNDIGQPWSWIIIEKQGSELCFVVNGVLQKKFHLDCDYLNWQKDGIELLGNYYRGVGENVQYGRLFVMVDGCKYKCGPLEIGHTFDYDITSYYQ